MPGEPQVSSLAIAVVTIERPQVIQRFISSVRTYYPQLPIYVADQSRGISPMRPFYAAHQASLIQMPYDAGVTAARNSLVAAMDQEYFVLCDDDFVFGADTHFSDAIEILKADLEIGVVGGMLYDFDGSTEHPRHWELFFDYDSRNRILITTPIYHLAPIARGIAGIRYYLCDAVMNFAVFRRSIFDQIVRWDERFKSNGEHEDFYLNLKVNSQTRVAYLPTMVAYHHQPETYNEYRRRLRGRNQGWTEFLRKWNLQQHLEIGYGVHTIDNVDAVVNAELTKNRVFLNSPLWLPQEAASAMAEGGASAAFVANQRNGATPVDHAARRFLDADAKSGQLKRKYALETEGREGIAVALGDSRVFFQYSPVHSTHTDFTLWYRGVAASPDLGANPLAVRIAWYDVDRRVLLSESGGKVLQLGETAYWKPLLLDVPPVPGDVAILRFEVVVSIDVERVPITTGFLYCSADDPRSGQSPIPDVLALSCLSAAELRQMPPPQAPGERNSPEFPELPLAPLGAGLPNRLLLADTNALEPDDLLVFKGWKSIGTSLLPVRVSGAIDGPHRIALPAADLADSGARVDFYSPAQGARQVSVQLPDRGDRTQESADRQIVRRNCGRRQSMGTVFKGFWHGPPLSLLHRVCLQSFVQQGHVFELYTYEDVDAGPGVTIRDANEILDRSELFYYKNTDFGSDDIAPFSDLFRLKLLLDSGGWWCDIDTICTTDSMPDFPYAWARDNPEVNPRIVSNGLVNCPRNDPIFRELYRRCRALRNVSANRREHFGSIPMSEFFLDLGLPLDMGGSPATFNPLRFIEMFKFWFPDFLSEVEAKAEAALVMPVYWSFAKYIGIDFSKLPPAGSFLDLIFNRYSPDNLKSYERYTEEQVVNLYSTWLFDKIDWTLAEMIAVSGESPLGYFGIVGPGASL